MVPGCFAAEETGYSDARAQVSATGDCLKLGLEAERDGWRVARRLPPLRTAPLACLAAGASQAGGELLPRAPARADVSRVEAAAALQR